MSNIEAAKTLLKKALALGDTELIELANSMLETTVTNFKYDCESCEHIFESKKPRKSCPKCKKRKLTQLINEPVIQQPKEVGVHRPMSNPQPLQRGNRQGRREPISVGKNMWTDTKEIGSDKTDKKIKELITKGQIAPTIRNRPGFRPIKVTCVHCNHVFEENPILVPLNDEGQRYYVCSSCGTSRR